MPGSQFFQGLSVSESEAFIQDRLSVDEAYLDRLFQGQSKAGEAGDQALVDERWMELVADLGVGEWVQQHIAGKNSRLLNPAWKNLEGERYLLVDGNGFKAFYLHARALAGMFADNCLERQKNPDQPIVERAVERIMQQGYDDVRYEISYDELTGVLNRRSFERVLTEMLHGEMAQGERHAMILLDVDQFGLVNDLCGFEGGDKLLQSVADILRTNLPEHSHLARIGDDEFAALMPGNGPDQGFQLAEAQRLAINAFKFAWDKQLIPVSASLGLAVIDSLGHTSAEFLKSASSACAIAKQAGRNCTRVYSVTDPAFIVHRELVNSQDRRGLHPGLSCRQTHPPV